MKDISIISIEGVDYNVEDKVARSRQSVQSDWAEDDASNPAYIRNKPTIPDGVECDTTMSATSEKPVQNKIIKAYVDNLINGLINGAPAALDTLNELSAALGNDSNFAATITNALAAKVDKVTGKGLSTNDYTDADKTAVGTIASKANDADVVKSISVNNVAQQKNNGNVNIVIPSGGLTKSDISVDTQGDGTVDINVADDTYTINLNHTHEGMAKLVVDTAANLPDVSEMESDTIYGEVEDGEISVLYVGGIPFYGGGGAVSGPVLRRPADGSTIDMDASSSTININGKGLTQDLTVEVDGTGFSFGNTQPSGVTIVSTTELTVSAAAANSVAGVDIAVEYAGTNPYATCSLAITSGTPDNISHEVSILYDGLVNAQYIKFTGQQYLLTDYHPNPKTHLQMDIQFEDNNNFTSSSANRYLFAAHNNTVGAFNANFGSDTAQFRNHECMYWLEKTYVSQTWIGVYPNNFFTRSTWTYQNDVVSFLGVNTNTEHKTTTQDGYFVLGSDADLSKIFNAANLIVYSIKIYEDDVLVREYLPKKSTSGNVYGMFETKTKQFITSGTSTGFEGA